MEPSGWTLRVFRPPEGLARQSRAERYGSDRRSTRTAAPHHELVEDAFRYPRQLAGRRWRIVVWTRRSNAIRKSDRSRRLAFRGRTTPGEREICSHGRVGEAVAHGISGKRCAVLCRTIEAGIRQEADRYESRARCRFH